MLAPGNILRIIWAAITVIFTSAAVSGCSQNNENLLRSFAAQSSIHSFRDVPGITAEEVDAIERLLSERESFRYGTSLTSESFVLPDGSYAGFTAKLCELLSNLFGIPFVQEFHEWDILFNGLVNHDIDFTGELTPTPARRQNFYMTSPIAERGLIVMFKEDAVNIETTSDLNGLKIGFFEGTITANFVQNMYPNLSFEIVNVRNIPEVVEKLSSREIDAFVDDSVNKYPFIINYPFIGYADVLSLVYTPVSLATANSALAPIISVMDKYLDAGGIDWLYELYAKGSLEYKRYMFNSLLTEEEKAYIADLKARGAKVPIALEHDNYPGSFYNQTAGEFQGFILDILSEISILSGIEFKPVNDNDTPWYVLFDMLKTGEAALISDLMKTDERMEHFIWSREPILSFNYAFLSKIDYPVQEFYRIPRSVVGVVRGYAAEYYYNKWFPENTNLRLYDTQGDAFNALERGEIDLYFTADISLSYQTHFRERAGYKVNLSIDSLFGYAYLGLNKNETLLRSIIEKAQGVINVNRIVSHWTQRTYDYRIKIAEARMPWLIGAVILAATVLFLLLIMFIRNFRILTLEKKAHDDIEKMMKQLVSANNENKSQLRKLNMVIKAANIGLWEAEVVKDDPFNPNNYAECSDEFRRMLGFIDEYDFPNVLGGWSLRVHPDDQEFAYSTLAKHMFDTTGNTPFDIEHRLQKKNGEYGYYRSTSKTIRDIDGTPLRVVGTLIDLTETRNLIDEAKRQRIEAENANRAKSEFLSHISHEIRTPMNAILGSTEIQLQKDHPADTEEAFAMIYNSGNLLLNIINDILDLSKIEAGKLELSLGKYDIPSIAYDVTQLNLLRYEGKPIDFLLKIDENTPLEMLGDELRVKQILNNILSNAFKYTNEGEIELSITAETTEPSGMDTHLRTGCILILSVRDTGQGMTEEQVGKLFEKYTRFNMDINRTTVGTGLGMSITKHFVDMMKGEIFVESEPGKGSVFTVRLPQERIGSAVCGADLADNLCSRRFQRLSKFNNVRITHEYMPYGSVLIVDDVESNLYVAKGLMLPYGLKIETASSGIEAVEKIKSGRVYDIVFMDHMMPKMNGIEAAEIIRGMGYTHPIVALTANAVTGQSELFMNNGFDGFISKPIDIRELNASLNRLIRDKQPPEVVKAARQMEQKNNFALAQNMIISNALANAVVRDIKNAVTVLKDLLLKINNSADSVTNAQNIKLYTTTVHGLKGSFANIGEMELADTALKLEQAGNNGDISAILNETSTFINAFQPLIEKLMVLPEPAQTDDSAEISSDDMLFIRDKMNDIKTACKEFNKKDIKTALNDLKQKALPQMYKDILEEISVNLLHGEFNKIISAAEKIISRVVR